MTQNLRNFLIDGAHPSSERDKSALLDEFRAIVKDQIAEEISSLAKPAAWNAPKSEKELLQLEQQSKATKAAREKSLDDQKTAFEKLKAERNRIEESIQKKQSMNPQKATAKPTPPQPTITAEEFASKPLIMKKSEFDKLTPRDKTRFATLGGKLI